MRKKRKKICQPKTKMEYFACQGGDDLITPTLSVDPGRAIITQNYELDMNGRYRLIDGYEAYDGHPKPSEANYWILNFDAGTNQINAGSTVTGAGEASGKVYLCYVSSGSWAGGTAAGYLVLFQVSGTYVDDETLSVGAVAAAVANGTQVLDGGSTDTLHSIFKLAAIEDRRDDIDAVPGSGSVLGVWQYNGVKYAFRNNSGGTAALMYKSSTTGWTACDLGETLAFSSGTDAFAEAETVSQGGVTATVKRVIVQSGSWATNDAAGYLVIYSRSGGNFSSGAITGSVSGAATATGAQTTTSLSPSGRYEFMNHNFGGHAGTRRMYGCDGVNNGFEWDGTVYVPIFTGMTTDTPIHLVAHKKHLFFLFSGGSIQHSSTGDPYTWSAVTGASELGIGDEGTGFISMPNVLAIYARNSTHVLYGTSISDWNLQLHSPESGAIEWSIQKIGDGLYLDDRGITSLSAVQEYGDFKANTLSKYIHPWLKTMLGSVQSSVRVKDKNQYRIFFSDKRAVTLTMDGNKVIGFARQLYDKVVSCCCSTENSSGQEEIFFGSDDGYVYQLDSGTSFNGNPIEAIVKFHFNHLKSPQIKKGIRHIILELDAPIDTYISANVEFNYGQQGNPAQFYLPESPGGIWGVDNWGQFIWGGGSIASVPLDDCGSGLNFSLTLYHSGIWELQEDPTVFDDEYIFDFDFDTVRSGLTGAYAHTIQGYIVIYDIRGIQR